MAEITDPTAIKFANDKIRTLADAYARLHKQAKEVCFLWQAKGMPALFPADPEAIVMDSANAGVADGPDGRTAITGADVNAVILLAGQFFGGNEANDNAGILLIGKVAVNP